MIVVELRGVVSFFKIGLQLIHSQQVLPLLDYLQKQRCRAFLDCKLHDIPHTMAMAAKNLMHPSVKFYDVHLGAGAKALQETAKYKGQAAMIGVTVLTSLSHQECQCLYGASPIAKVKQFARLALENNVDGIVCSPQEIAIIKKDPQLKKLITIVPGIRPSWAPSNDQQRALTPAEAIKAGADYLVIGRPITAPPANVNSRFQAAQLVIKEIEEVYGQ